jgi:hypothetical protein
MESGENKAWEILAAADPAAVCRNAEADFIADSGLYTLRSFNSVIQISQSARQLESSDPAGEVLLGRLCYFSRLSILWYMTSAKDVPLSGRLVNPGNLKGGQLFFRGTHVLPLERLAEKYTADSAAFVTRGVALGGEKSSYGDASVTLYPLPRIPVTLILWCGDEEFPPRADLLFDSSCESHLALDILWSIAMMSVLIMM